MADKYTKDNGMSIYGKLSYNELFDAELFRTMVDEELNEVPNQRKSGLKFKCKLISKTSEKVDIINRFELEKTAYVLEATIPFEIYIDDEILVPAIDSRKFKVLQKPTLIGSGSMNASEFGVNKMKVRILVG